MGATVRILLFANAREVVGRAVLRVSLPPRGLALPDLLRNLNRRHAGLERVLRTCRIARNGRYLRGDGVRIRPGDEIAIHPPFSGG